MKASLLTCISLSALWAAPSITKVEPPNWWPNHTLNPVLLLIRGTDLSGARVTVTGLKTANVRVNTAGTYLFVDIEIPAQRNPANILCGLKRPAAACKRISR